MYHSFLFVFFCDLFFLYNALLLSEYFFFPGHAEFDSSPPHFYLPLILFFFPHAFRSVFYMLVFLTSSVPSFPSPIVTPPPQVIPLLPSPVPSLCFTSFQLTLSLQVCSYIWNLHFLHCSLWIRSHTHTHTLS